MDKKYRCSQDLQQEGFCVGDINTVSGWKERALYWLDCDGYDGEEETGFYQYLSNLENPQKIMDEIAEWWQLDFEEVK